MLLKEAYKLGVQEAYNALAKKVKFTDINNAKKYISHLQENIHPSVQNLMDTALSGATTDEAILTAANKLTKLEPVITGGLGGLGHLDPMIKNKASRMLGTGKNENIFNSTKAVGTRLNELHNQNVDSYQHTMKKLMDRMNTGILK